MSDVAAVRHDDLLPQAISVGIVGLRQVDHLLIGLSEALLIALPGSPGVPDENHLILRSDVLHQLRQVLPQSLGVALVSLGDFLDERLLRLVNEDHGGLQQSPHLQGISAVRNILTWRVSLGPWRRGGGAC